MKMGGSNDDDDATTTSSNLVNNYSFETGSLDPWVVTNNGSTSIDDSTYTALVIDRSTTDVITGSYAFNYWVQDANVLNLDLTQSVSVSETGTYDFSLYIEGAASNTNYYAYVLDSNGTSLGQVTLTTSSWGNWKQFSITGLSLTGGTSVTVGAHIEASGADSWGYIDDVVLEPSS